MGNHSDWTYLFWDRESAQIFLDTHYPWFSATFKGYPKTVLQGAICLSLLHAPVRLLHGTVVAAESCTALSE